MLDRFMAKVDKRGPDECWEWTAYRAPFGYGRFGVGGRKGGMKEAHRVSWQLFRGTIPEKMNVCHKCDNPPCVNPNHLFLGTQKDNIKDARNKGRSKTQKENYYSDERHNSAKMTNEQVRLIRSGKIKPIDAAKKFGVWLTTIYDAKRGTTFRDIE